MPTEGESRDPLIRRSFKLLGVAAMFAVCAAFSVLLLGLANWLIGRVLMPKLPHGGL